MRNGNKSNALTKSSELLKRAKSCLHGVCIIEPDQVSNLLNIYYCEKKRLDAPWYINQLGKLAFRIQTQLFDEFPIRGQSIMLLSSYLKPLCCCLLLQQQQPPCWKHWDSHVIEVSESKH